MLNILNFLEPSNSEAELRLHIGRMLGIGGPVPVAVMRRALVDEAYTLYLVRSRGQRELVELLLLDPKNDKYADEPGSSPSAGEGPAERTGELSYDRSEPPALKEYSNLELIWKAGKAVAKWGAAGFERVETERFEARFGACEACEYLVSPPNRLLYKVQLVRRSDPRVCSACGCVAARKASLPTESCPVAHRDNPRLNRWGEPRSPVSTDTRR